MKNILIVAFMLFLNALTQPLFSQNDGNYFSLGVNSDAFGGMELGYARHPGFLKGKNQQLYVRFSIPLLLAVKGKSFDSWELKIGARSELFKKNNFGVLGDVQLFMMHHQQILGDFLPLGMNVRLTPCYHFSKGYLGFQMNWNQILATRISHAQYVKNTFGNMSSSNGQPIDMHPKDGWYADTGSQISFGIEGNWEMNPKISVYGDLGIIQFSSPYTGMFDAMMMGQVPFYGNLRLLFKM